MKPIIVGICGGTGSGKSTLVRRIKSALPDQVTVITLDSFYREQPNTTYEERTKTNYDHPEALDKEVMLPCIQTLKDGRNTRIPVYDFTVHNRSTEPWVEVESRPVIVLDGILLFAIPELMEIMDFKIFVDCDADIRILRRALRDNRDRARSLESVIDQYMTTVRPMHEKFIEPHKNEADIIVPRGGKNDVAVAIIISAIEKKLSEAKKNES